MLSAPPPSRRLGLGRLLLAWAPVLAFQLLVIYLSTRPTLQTSQLPYLDKVAHFSEYAVYAGLIYRALRLSGARLPHAPILAMLLVVVLAAGDEVLQSKVPNRDSSVRDWAADVAGGVAGVLVARILERRFPPGWLAPGRERGVGRLPRT